MLVLQVFVGISLLVYVGGMETRELQRGSGIQFGGNG